MEENKVKTGLFKERHERLNIHSLIDHFGHLRQLLASNEVNSVLNCSLESIEM